MSAQIRVLFVTDDASRASATMTSLGRDLREVATYLDVQVLLHQQGAWPESDAQCSDADLVVLFLEPEAAVEAMGSMCPLTVPYMVLLSKRAVIDHLPPYRSWHQHLVAVRRWPIHGIEALEMLRQYMTWRVHRAGLV